MQDANLYSNALLCNADAHHITTRTTAWQERETFLTCDRARCHLFCQALARALGHGHQTSHAYI